VLLDSGVSRQYPLLAPFIANADLHTVNPAWGTNDTANHGTGLAGLVALGDLSDALDSDEPLYVAHHLESVKLTPEHGANPGGSREHGYLFAEAVARPEVEQLLISLACQLSLLHVPLSSDNLYSSPTNFVLT